MILIKKRVFGPIASINDLKILQDEANDYLLTAVGVHTNGSLFIYDHTKERHVAIKDVDAADILELTLEQIHQVISTRGRVRFEDDFREETSFEDDITSEDDVSEVLNDELIEEEIDVVEDEDTFQEEVTETETEDIQEVIEDDVSEDEELTLKEKLTKVNEDLEKIIESL